MAESLGAPIIEHFASLDDPRIDRTKRRFTGSGAKEKPSMV